MNGLKYPCYVMRKDQSGGWYWLYYASNARAIARSSESYVAKSDCEHSIHIVKQSGNAPVYSE